MSLVAVFAASMLTTAIASAEGPYWHVGGTKLNGIKQLKLQSKGTAVLKATPAAGESFVIECANSVSEGATIEGGAIVQGQGKGRVTYTQCKTSLATCKVAEPITTNQVKSYLAVSSEAQSKLVSVFVPTQGTKFVEIKLSGTNCGVLPIGANPVSGSAAAEVRPAGQETQEGLLNFPVTAIKEAKHEGQTVTGIALTISTLKATFSGIYGARLEPTEAFGVFTQ